MKFNNLLVTGGAGFIGSNFIRYVFEKTDFQGRIINFDALTYAGNPNSLNDISAKYKDRYVFVHADIRDREAIRRAFKEFDVDAIAHFAAESHVDRSIVSPDDFIHIVHVEKHSQQFGGAGIHLVMDLEPRRRHTVVQLHKQSLLVESVDTIDFARIADDRSRKGVEGMKHREQQIASQRSKGHAVIVASQN